MTENKPKKKLGRPAKRPTKVIRVPVHLVEKIKELIKNEVDLIVK